MKKRIAAVILSILLLAAGTGIWTAQEVKAASSLSVILNGQALQLADPVTVKSGTAVLVPLREVAEALKYKITYIGSTGTVQLTRVQETIEFKLSGQEVTLADKTKVTYKEAIETRQKKLYVPLSFLNSIGLITSYNQADNQVEIYSPEVTAGAVSTLLATGQYQELQTRYLSTIVNKESSLPLIQQNWEQVTTPAGNYFGVKSTTSSHIGDEFTIQSVLSFTASEAVLTLTLDGTGKITGLKLEPLAAEPVSASPSA